jgi:lipoyl(octanoyl) transferase
VRWIGHAPYDETWRAMREFTAQRAAGTPDELWVVEHPPVYTFGLAGRRAHLRDTGRIAVVASDRGGQVTFHGPGQVIVYTLIDLRRLGIYVKDLVYRIEQSVLQTLDAAGIDGLRVPGAPGVYVRLAAAGGAGDERSAADPVAARFAGVAKIAAIGIRVSNGRSYHGVALNVAMDLAPFAAIDSCGYPGLVTTDLATLGSRMTWESAARTLSARLAVHLA